jgi:hypothetical protein
MDQTREIVVVDDSPQRVHLPYEVPAHELSDCVPEEKREEEELESVDGSGSEYGDNPPSVAHAQDNQVNAAQKVHRGEGDEEGWKDYFSPSNQSNAKPHSRVLRWEDQQEDGEQRKEEREMRATVSRLQEAGKQMMPVLPAPATFVAGADSAEDDARQAEADLAAERAWSQRKALLFEDVGGAWSSPEAESPDGGGGQHWNR